MPRNATKHLRKTEQITFTKHKKLSQKNKNVVDSFLKMVYNCLVN